jgi:hypothetical protein
MVKTPLRAIVIGLIAVSAVYRVSDGRADAFDAFRSLAMLLCERRAGAADISLAVVFPGGAARMAELEKRIEAVAKPEASLG